MLFSCHSRKTTATCCIRVMKPHSVAAVALHFIKYIIRHQSWILWAICFFPTDTESFGYIFLVVTFTSFGWERKKYTKSLVNTSLRFWMKRLTEKKLKRNKLYVETKASKPKMKSEKKTRTSKTTSTRRDKKCKFQRARKKVKHQLNCREQMRKIHIQQKLEAQAES